MMAQADAAASFDPLRPRLVRAAYRMLGSVADAEDVVQDAFIRWLGADRDAVRDRDGYLLRIVTRLCLDVLKSARHRRETYLGPWLPEPVVAEDEDEVEDVTLPLLMALERLSPLERAAFLLHDVFGASFEEVAETIERDAAACRQLASRARAHVRGSRLRFTVEKKRGREIAEAFFTASRTGDRQALQALLASDVAIYSDGGGKRPAARKPIEGLERVLAVHDGLARLWEKQPSRLVSYGLINGLPGFITREGDGLLQTTALHIGQDGGIIGIFIMRNPDKLARLEGRVQ
jgi:RNA polymerase sigma-70 factor (ECF subfamily)